MLEPRGSSKLYHVPGIVLPLKRQDGGTPVLREWRLRHGAVVRFGPARNPGPLLLEWPCFGTTCAWRPGFSSQEIAHVFFVPPTRLHVFHCGISWDPTHTIIGTQTSWLLMHPRPTTE